MEIERIRGGHSAMASLTADMDFKTLNLRSMEDIMFLMQYQENLQRNTMIFIILKNIALHVIEWFVCVKLGTNIAGFAERERSNPAYDPIIGQIAAAYTNNPADIQSSQMSPVTILIVMMLVNAALIFFANKINVTPEKAQEQINNIANGGWMSMLGSILGGYTPSQYVSAPPAGTPPPADAIKKPSFRG
jgi:hypothetical protein